MFLTADEVQFILNKPFFSNPVTENDSVYVFYRGRQNIQLYTVRFNLIPSFSVRTMIATLQSSLFQRFPPHAPLHVTVMHDLLLCGDPKPPSSFYIYRANTNRHVINPDEERYDFDMTLTLLNVINCCHSATEMNPSDFDIYFVNSSVTVHRVLSLVITFEGPRI